MSKKENLTGDPQAILRLLLAIISSTSTNPLFHISEIVQNEIDAGATEIAITFFRKRKKLEKIVIEGNGHGFLESFEHYRRNIGDSIKNKIDIYIKRKEKGQARGEFCIGLQGFRGICKELQIINLTREGMEPRTKEGKPIDDPDFKKMFRNRMMILRDGTLEMEMKEEDEMKVLRKTPGTTAILKDFKISIKPEKLVKYLSSNKRNELMSNRKLKIKVIDGKYFKVVQPIEYEGEKWIRKFSHPKEEESFEYRGFGKVKVELYLHEPRKSSKVRLDIKNEPVLPDITQLEEFNRFPWDSEMVEGIIEYPRLTKSPLRNSIQKDDFYWAFVEIMKEIEKELEFKIKEYENKIEKQRDKKLMKKLKEVMAEVKRDLEFETWFKGEGKKRFKGPIAELRLLPETLDLPAFSTYKVYAKAYDSEDQEITNDENLKFEWNVTGQKVRIKSQGKGWALLYGESRLGKETVSVKVTDTRINKTLERSLEVVVTHPLKRNGKLVRVKIEPTISTLEIEKDKIYKAIALDHKGDPIDGVSFSWEILFDNTEKATIEEKRNGSTVLKAGKNPGIIKLGVKAYKNGKTVSDFAVIQVVEKKRPSDRSKRKNIGLPIPEPIADSTSFPMWHSRLKNNGEKLEYNIAHPDYKALEKDEKRRQKYIANLYAKELAIKECEKTGTKDVGEKMLEVLSKIEKYWK